MEWFGIKEEDKETLLSEIMKEVEDEEPTETIFDLVKKRMSEEDLILLNAQLNQGDK